MERAVADLESAWGSATVPWGAVNRLRPRTARAGAAAGSAGSLPEPSDSAGLPVGGAPAWARTAFVFAAPADAALDRRSGERGTRWVAAVRLAGAPRAYTVMPFGHGAPGSSHGFDQAPLYASGRLKDAPFHREDVLAAARGTYRPVDAAVRELP
jgi:acyl-homoserine lactone acylase PvdQ